MPGSPGSAIRSQIPQRSSPSCWAARTQVTLAPLLDEAARRCSSAIVAEAGDRRSLWEAIVATKPDVAIIDVRMPPNNRLDGLEAAIEIRNTYPDTGVLVLSQYLESRYLTTLLGENARSVGYLLKERVSGANTFRRRADTGGLGRLRYRPGGGVADARLPPSRRPAASPHRTRT